MYQVFYKKDNVVIMNDDNGKEKELTSCEEKTMFENNALLKTLRESKTKVVYLDNIYDIKDLP